MFLKPKRNLLHVPDNRYSRLSQSRQIIPLDLLLLKEWAEWETFGTEVPVSADVACNLPFNYYVGCQIEEDSLRFNLRIHLFLLSKLLLPRPGVSDPLNSSDNLSVVHEA